MSRTTSTEQLTPRTVTTGRGAASRRRRVVEAVVFVAVWMAAGSLLDLGADAYLLLGVPLTAAFQLLVRRRPLRELFVQGSTRFVLSRGGAVAAVALAVVPGYHAVDALLAADPVRVGWYVAAMAGAVAASFSIRAITVLGMLRNAAVPIAIGSTGMSLVYAIAHVVTSAPLPVAEALEALVTYTLLYLPATFLLEEVAFRGAIDAHVHHDGEQRGWRSAVFVSAVWGLWHLPVASSGLPLPLLLGQLVVVHVTLGVPLSFAWRRSGNLAGPALGHAVNDAVRNAAMLGL